MTTLYTFMLEIDVNAQRRNTPSDHSPYESTIYLFFIEGLQTEQTSGSFIVGIDGENSAAAKEAIELITGAVGTFVKEQSACTIAYLDKTATTLIASTDAPTADEAQALIKDFIKWPVTLMELDYRGLE